MRIGVYIFSDIHPFVRLSVPLHVVKCTSSEVSWSDSFHICQDDCSPISYVVFHVLSIYYLYLFVFLVFNTIVLFIGNTTELTLPEHTNSPTVFSGLVLLDLQFSVQCFVDRCLFFFFWPLCCLSFFDLRILINPLVSSKLILIRGSL